MRNKKYKTMNGKLFRITYAVILFFAAFTACSDEQPIDLQDSSWQGNHKVSLFLKAVPETRSGTRAVSVPVEEGNSVGYQVKDFVIFQFDQNGNRLVDPKYYEYEPGESGQTIPIMLPTEDNVEYTIVVLANSHNELADITFAEATTLDKLMGKYQKFEKFEDSYKENGTGYDLLMNGYTTINKNTSSLSVELYRNVAKFTLTITNPSTSGVILKTAQVKSVPTKIDYFYHLLEDKNPTALTAPYPAHNKFTTFDYPIDEFEVRPGEGDIKLTYYLPCHLMGTSSCDSEKRKGDFAPDYATFIEMYGVSEDGSTYTRYRFYLGDNWINDYNITPNYHYQLPIKFTSMGNPQADTRVHHVSGIVEEPDANSYIVNPLPIEEQRMYKIPVAWRINTFWTKEEEGNYIPSSTAYTIIGENEWAADIIWQSSDQQLIEFYDDNGRTGNEGRMSPKYRGQKPLCFKPKKGAKGNVLVGVYRTDQANAADPTKREYSWSWHLWITDYNPDDCVNQNWDGRYKSSVTNGEVHRYMGTLWDDENAIYHNKWIMDRFLGAFDNSGTDYQSYGLFYRFGMHLPYQNSYEKNYRYNSQTDTFSSFNITNESYMFNRYQHIIYPTRWGKGNNEDFIADNQEYRNNIWNDPTWNIERQGGKTKKSFFDPCPPGWRIPEYKFLECQGTGAISQTLIIYCDNVIGSDNRAIYPLNGGKESGTGHGWANQFTMSHTSTPSGNTVWALYSQNNKYGYEYFNGSTHIGLRTTAKGIRPVQE
ncbi:MAG: hypothetical protein ACI36X_09375 [Bacteroidaceae bacterium]